MILKRLLKPPSVPADVIQRDRLNGMLEFNSGKSLVLVCAAAGYGKTVLLADSFSRTAKVSWLQGDPMIENILSLFEYLTESIRQNNPLFGTRTIEFISGSTEKWDNSEAAINDIVIVFVNDYIDNVFDETILIIDDFHLICESKSEQLNTAINMLLKYLPVSLKIVISSREMPELELMRLKAKRKYIELNTGDLAFTSEEISELIIRLYNEEIDEFEAEKLKEFTSGWVTGIHLMRHSALKSFSVDDNESDVFSYVAEDIFDNLDPLYREFTLSTSLLGSFTSEDADFLLGINTSNSIVKELIRKNIFMEVFGSGSGSGTSYSYQKLFSAFLRSSLEKSIEQEALRTLYRNSSLIYMKRKEIAGAIDFSLLAQEPQLSTEILNNNFEVLLESGEYQTMKKCFDLIGFEAICNNNKALLNLLRLSISIGSLSEAEKCLGVFKTMPGFDFENQFFEEYQLCNAEYLLLSSRYDESIAILENIVNSKAGRDDYERSVILLAKNYYRKGFEHYDKVIELTNDLLEPGKISDITIRIEVLKMLGNIYCDRGEQLTTIKFYEQTLELESNSVKTFKTRANLSDFYSNLGKYDKAHFCLECVRELFKKFPIVLFQRYYLRSLFNFQSSIGNYPSAILTLEEVETNETLKRDVSLSFIHWITQSEVFYRSGNKSMSRQSLNMIRNSELRNVEFYKLLFLFCDEFYASDDIKSHKTEDALINILQFYKERNVHLVISLVEFHLAEHYLLCENFETALGYLAKSLESLRTKQFIAFAQQQYVLSRHVYDFAVSQNIEKKFISDIHLSVIEKVELPFIDDEFRQKLLKDIDKITDIRFCPFGKTEFYLRGELVHEDKWIRKKSKVLLAYLMSDPEKVHTKDKIMDMFFDDMPMDKADVVYHSTIYNIRTALKVYELKSDKPKRSKSKSYDYNPQYILYEDKTLRLNPDFYYVSDNIEFERYYEKAKLPSLSNEEKIKHSIKAIELYKGDFLPGYYESWTEELREKYKNMYITLTEDMIKLLESEKRHEEVVKYSEMLLREDKLNDEAHVSIIKAYSALGNINMAKSRYQIMLKIFEEELGEKPSQKTLDKIKSVLE